MAYKITDWKYSGEIDRTNIPIIEGIRTLLIKDAKYSEFDENGEPNEQYSLTTEDLENGAEITLNYWLNSINEETGKLVSNASQRGTLISIGSALFGKAVGIPAPCDVIGGVVRADVKLAQSKKGKIYPRVYKFTPAKTEDVETYAMIEQYSVEE